MKKIRFGTPEKIVPTAFCKNLNYTESDVKYDLGKIKFRTESRGCIVEFPVEKDEQIYGFGLQLKGFNHKGRKLCLRTNSDPAAYTGDSHAPVPFFVTTKGYGMYFDTARYIEAYCGYNRKRDRKDAGKTKVGLNTDEIYKIAEQTETSTMLIQIPAAKGIDIYIFEGDTITDIVSQYNMFSGGGCNVPDWGFEVLYRAYADYNQDKVSELADFFRQNDYEVGIIGLEPGWQTNSYSCSYIWDKERFPNPDNLIKELREKNYHINLWEHAFTSAAAPFYKEIMPYCGEFEVWRGIVPDFATKEARKIFADYHSNYLVKHGIDGFKLDECDSSDYVSHWSFPNCAEFPSGMDGEQYHQLFGILYMQAILEALGENKTLSEVRSAGALASSYPFVLYSDLYDHRDFIRGTVNSGFSGILWTPELRDAKSKDEFLRRLQTTVFSVQCVVNAWYCPEVPWKDLDCENEVKELFRTRKALIPILKKAFKDYKETGKPPVRALVSDYTDDCETYGIDDEYIFCDDIIAAPIMVGETERKVYLPQGNWIDYWTKEPVESGWFDVKTDKIPVYEKIKEQR
ncbi:MAG: glycoside hydrolase family 31 protein [Clostridia bacterium]|nr:glycoside hydrolase [Oscillospiraceae bacterium]MDY3302695.1 glycoside hydrolase family 31 protein [Clostridia bacterium]MDY5626714.1 glycoside hydrolase family 31 protein [Clostridia bacterium]